MAHRAAARASAARRNGSTVLRLAVLVVFFLQSFLVQTHVHAMPLAASAHAAVSAPQGGSAPLDMDHCLLCQEYVHAGAYMTPAIAATLPPTVIVGLVRLIETPLLLAKPLSHDWMGRAPPRA